MIEAFEIGVSLALRDGVSDGIAAARRDLARIDAAIRTTSTSIHDLRKVGFALLEPTQQAGEGARDIACRVPSLPKGTSTADASPADAAAETAAPAGPPASRLAGSPVPVYDGTAAVTPRKVLQDEAVRPAQGRTAAETASWKAPPLKAPAGGVWEAKSDAGNQGRGHPTGEPGATAAASNEKLPTEAAVLNVQWTTLPPTRPAGPAAATVAQQPVRYGAPSAPSAVAPGAPGPAMQPASWVAPTPPREGKDDVHQPRNATDPGQIRVPARMAGASNASEAAADGVTTQGDVFLDGMLVGRWISRFLAREAGRDAAGLTGFDPRRNPIFPGPTVGS